MVSTTKQQLQKFRLEGFDSILKEVTTFCEKYDIELVDMDAAYIDWRCRRKKTNITNRHYYEFDNFNTVLDMQIQELNNRFNEVTTELLTCMGSLSPDDNFEAFDLPKLLRLAEMYPYDFSCEEKEQLMHELENYFANIREDKRFANVKGISNLAKKLVETKKHLEYLLIYRLLRLTLVLPVATASVEMCFSSMKYVKSDLRNRMSDGYLNDACICYIEKEAFAKVDIEHVMERFQDMKKRREQLK